MISSQQRPKKRVDDVASTVQQVIDLAVTGLPQMFDKNSGLFCYTMQHADRGLVQQGLSRRYTIITLMGLYRLEESGRPAPIAIAPVLDQLLDNLDWVDNIGDLGLLLWLTSLMAPDRLAGIETRLGLREALTRYPDAKEGRTMELSWFLSGLCHWALAKPEKAPHFRDLVRKTYKLVMDNQGKQGYFRHLGRNSVGGRLRGWMGSFADQVYPIYALTQLFQAYQDETAVQEALRCTHGLCQAQGSLGQWWWHYDSLRGRVFEGYPVFSVHQHGMAPMTLFALGEATNTDFNFWIYRGLEWIHRRNELGFDMEDSSAKVIWRCIFQPPFQRYWAAAFQREVESKGDQLRVLFECRPYELGWLLYAFAGRLAAYR
jgi:hypothetical protein